MLCRTHNDKNKTNKKQNKTNKKERKKKPHQSAQLHMIYEDVKLFDS